MVNVWSCTRVNAYRRSECEGIARLVELGMVVDL
jgi:hypothetical protein